MKPSSASRSSVNRPAGAALGILLPFLLAAGQAPSESLPQQARARRVIDGDTLELQDGRRVRHIGIDAPEARRRAGGEWIEDPEPMAREATDAHRHLVDGRDLRLELDAQTHDKHGRLLAYVYAAGPDGQDVMVSEELLRQGLAQPMTIPPNVKYAERFRAVAAEARQAKRGLWKLK